MRESSSDRYSLENDRMRMMIDDDDHDSFASITNQLEDLRSRKVKLTSDDMIICLDTLIQYAEKNGMTPDQLTLLSKIFFKFSDKRIAHRIIKCFIPNSYVPSGVVINLIGPFQKYDGSLRILVYKWLCMTYDLVDAKEIFRNLYQFFFRHLKDDSLRQWACNILYRITRREDVRPFRIRQLFVLFNQIGPELWLVVLLRLYKEYHNDMLLPLLSRRRYTFKCPDLKWYRKLMDIQLKFNAAYEPVHIPFAFRVQSSVSLNWKRKALDITQSTKKLKLSESLQMFPGSYMSLNVPTQRTIPFEAHHSWGVEKQPIYIEQLTSWEDFLQYFDRASLPNHVASALRSSFLAHFLVLKSDVHNCLRINSWISFVTDEIFYWRDHQKCLEEKTNFFKYLVNFVLFIKETPVPFVQFLIHYLYIWNFTDNVDEILFLISYIPPLPYRKIYKAILKPITERFITLSSVTKSRIFHSFAQLLQNWLFLYSETHEEGDEVPFFYFWKSEMVDYVYLISHFKYFVDKLAIVAIQVDNSPVVSDGILKFFEIASNAVYSWGADMPLMPSRALIYLLFLETSAMPISRICGILSNCRRESRLFTERGSSDEIKPMIKTMNNVSETMYSILFEGVVPEEKRKELNIDETTSQLIYYPNMPNQMNVAHSLAFFYLGRNFLLNEGKNKRENMLEKGPLQFDDKQLLQKYMKYLSGKNKCNMEGLEAFKLMFQ